MRHGGVCVVVEAGGWTALAERLVARAVGVATGWQGMVDVLLTDAERMRALNGAWRQVARATDVLAFPSNVRGRGSILGDVAVGWEACVRQGGMYGRVVSVQAARLAVHGALHLMGHDHEGEMRAARRMAREEKRVMHILELSAPAPALVQ